MISKLLSECISTRSFPTDRHVDSQAEPNANMRRHGTVGLPLLYLCNATTV